MTAKGPACVKTKLLLRTTNFKHQNFLRQRTDRITTNDSILGLPVILMCKLFVHSKIILNLSSHTGWTENGEL